MLLKTAVQTDACASIHCIFPVLNQLIITQSLTGSNCCSKRGRDNDWSQELRHFAH